VGVGRRWAVGGVVTIALAVVAASLSLGRGTGTTGSRRDVRRQGTAQPARPRTFGAVSSTHQPKPPSCPWLDSSLPVSTRVGELLAAMTPAEEASLLHLHQISAAIPYQGYTLPVPRLCIPLITEQDGAAGVAMKFSDVTQLPAPIADAAAWDPALANSYGNVIGSEDAAKGVDMALAPTINIDRSPYWGRSYETLGEDPYLTAALGVAVVRGIQSNRVVAVVKHFAAYNQETNRSTLLDDSIVTEQALREVYLPAFSAVVQQAKPGGVMCAYNLINGTPACEDGSLIDQVLRDEWHFGGFVRSDCNSVYAQAPAIAAGVSQVKCSRLYNPAQLATMPKASLDALARPLLTVLFEGNLIAEPHTIDRDAVATTAAHVQVALQTANEGSVLLRNDKGLLPINPARVGSVALIGAYGATPMPAGFGAMYVLPTHPVSAETALRSVFGGRLHYDTGADPQAAANLARRSEVAVVVVNDTESEHLDRTTLSLTPREEALITAVAAANPRTVVVLETGSAVLMPWLNQVGAVLETWYPGEVAGTSLAELLTGAVDPSGKLPVTFPASAAAMPAGTPATFGGLGGRTRYTEGVDVGYRWYEAHNVVPAFPFGFGLSYTKFAFSHLKVSTTAGGSVLVEATVTNDGKVAGADVVQCYVGAPVSAGEPPRQLRGFRRVELAPGASAPVHLTLPIGDFASWDTSQHSWVAGGTYKVFVGDSSDVAHLPLKGQVRLLPTVLGPNSGPAPTP
jgi:beta-glucosidase